MKSKLKRIEQRFKETMTEVDIGKIAENIGLYFEYFTAVEEITNGGTDSPAYPLYVEYNKNGLHDVHYPTGEVKQMTKEEIGSTGRKVFHFEEVENNKYDDYSNYIFNKYLSD